VYINAYNIFVSGPKFTEFLYPIGEGT